MSSTVWDQEFFRRKASGQQATSQVQESVAAAPLAAESATIAGLVLARAEDDNTALLFEDQRWSWRELVREAAVRAGLMQDLRLPGRPRRVGVPLGNVPGYIFLLATGRLLRPTAEGSNPS